MRVKGFKEKIIYENFFNYNATWKPLLANIRPVCVRILKLLARIKLLFA